MRSLGVASGLLEELLDGLVLDLPTLFVAAVLGQQLAVLAARGVLDEKIVFQGAVLAGHAGVALAAGPAVDLHVDPH
ncbi:hypothetical protein GCM10023321_70170 [Pseudonocardia eucalypti]|uniref:Uncharacterized protein n=1 Tax=Pseudonocardia eucalypti TaxID=648755 RepID=A0ABP9R4B8_9PSEU